MKKLFLVNTILLLFVSTSLFSQVIYTDFDPDVTLNSWDGYPFKPDPLRTITIWFHPWSPNQVVIQTSDVDCEVLWDANGRYPAKLTAGDNIGSSGTWKAADYDTLSVGGTYGNWAGGDYNKYIAYRYKLSGDWHYGWLRVDIDEVPSYVIIKDAAHQSSEGVTIKAGETAATGIGEVSKSEISMVMNGGNLFIYTENHSVPVHIALYDLKGQELMNMSTINGSPIDLSTYPQGLYVVNITSGTLVKRVKIQLQ